MYLCIGLRVPQARPEAAGVFIVWVGGDVGGCAILEGSA